MVAIGPSDLAGIVMVCSGIFKPNTCIFLIIGTVLKRTVGQMKYGAKNNCAVHYFEMIAILWEMFWVEDLPVSNLLNY